MEAIIKKLELKKKLNAHYIKIELTDSNGNSRVVDKPFLNNPISFRKQVFGIMSACDNFDLMRLATSTPTFKKMIGYYATSLQILENEKNEWLIYDKEKEEYTCKKSSKKRKRVFDTLIENNLSNLSKEEGSIEKILSQSGAFKLLFNSRNGVTFFTTRQIYYGFGYPLNIGREENIKEVKKSAKVFTSFIVNLMKLYGINDLLDFGKDKDNLPLVEITINNNNEISSITNPNTGMGLSIDKKFNMINRFDQKKEVKIYKNKY